MVGCFYSEKIHCPQNKNCKVYGVVHPADLSVLLYDKLLVSEEMTRLLGISSRLSPETFLVIMIRIGSGG